MKIDLKKFGTVLISRQAGKEAYLAFKPTLDEIKKKEDIEIDFDGVSTFSPSWGDEFLRPLSETYKERLFLRKTDNPSVKLTLELIEETSKIKFQTKKAK